MRWEALFADLEGQAESAATRDRAAEVDELTRAEVSRLELTHRIRPSIGSPVALRCVGGASLAGRLIRMGSDWLLVDEGAGREALVATAALVSVGGLGRLSAAPDPVDRVGSRLTLARALRGIARDRSPVALHLIDGRLLTGTVDRVGRDFLELAAHPGAERRRAAEVRELLVVVQAAVAVVRREP